MAVNSEDKEAFYFLVKFLNPDRARDVGKIQAQIGNTEWLKIGLRKEAIDKQARPDNSGQGSNVNSSARVYQHGFDEKLKLSFVAL